MEKIFNMFSLIGGTIGGVLAYLFGGSDAILIALVVLVILDYITGLIKAFYTKTVSSEVGFKGLLKKFLIFIVVVTAVVLQRVIDNAIPLREVTIMFFICNEAISLLENSSEFIPIPQKLKDVLLQLRASNDTEQKGGASVMKFSQWINTYLGRKTDYDGVYGVQCVDLIDCYIDKCLGLKKGYWGNAKYWWTERNTSKWLKDNFEFITPSYRNGELKAGDIGIRTSGAYGHIFIVKEPTANGRIKYYDQNATGSGDKMTLRERPYTSYYINGVLRPKDRKNIDTERNKTMAYGNAAMASAQTVYADSDLTLKVGTVSKGERVNQLGTGEGNPMISYKTASGYKVGFTKKGTVRKD